MDWIHNRSICQRCQRFISFFGDVIVQSAPHIYLSALAFAPQQSEIVKKFRHEFPRLLSAEIGQMAVWPATIAVLEGHTGVVSSVAFSPDGKHISLAPRTTPCGYGIRRAGRWLLGRLKAILTVSLRSRSRQMAGTSS
ncbi:hypothetical protein B0H10DRAFT_2283411, partial [Mycena sp. CBHHK59/15]